MSGPQPKLASSVDYSHLAKFSRWTPHQAAAALAEVDPDKIKFEAAGYRRHDPKATRYLENLELVQAARQAGEIRTGSPIEYLEWAQARHIDVPPSLLDAIQAHGVSVTDLRVRIEQLEADKAAMAARMSELEATSRAEAVKSLGSRERKNLLLMIYAMARKKFGYDPTHKNAATKAIASLTVEVGGEASEDSVLNKLKEGADLAQ